MAKVLFVATHGTDDPTRATFSFMEAKGVVETGHETGIILMLEAAPLIKDHIAEQVQGIGTPPLKELMDWLFARDVRISVCEPSGRALGVTEDDFAGKNSGFRHVSGCRQRLRRVRPDSSRFSYIEVASCCRDWALRVLPG